MTGAGCEVDQAGSPRTLWDLAKQRVVILCDHLAASEEFDAVTGEPIQVVERVVERRSRCDVANLHTQLIVGVGLQRAGQRLLHAISTDIAAASRVESDPTR